jgi:tetratricopeptide (TPR) repeat protein
MCLWVGAAKGEDEASQSMGHAPTLLQLGVANLMHKNPEKAEEYFRQMTVQTPEDAQGWGNLGVSLILQNRNAEAADALSRAVALDPKNAQYRANRSLALRAVKFLPEAIAEAKEAVRIDPSNPLFSNRLLLMRIQNGEIRGVKQEIQTWQSSGLSSMKANWVMAAAAVAAIQGDLSLCTAQLAESSTLLPPETRKLLLSDPVFGPLQSKILSTAPREPVPPPRKSPVFLPFR